MLRTSLETLAATPPPRKLRHLTYPQARHREMELSRALGRPVDPNIEYNIGKANERVRALEQELAQRSAQVPAATAPAATQPTVPVVTSSATSTAYTKSLPDYLALGADARAQFAADGGQLSRNDFDRLTPAARMAHCRHGGGISDFVPNGRRSGGEPKETNSGN